MEYARENFCLSCHYQKLKFPPNSWEYAYCCTAAVCITDATMHRHCHRFAYHGTHPAVANRRPHRCYAPGRAARIAAEGGVWSGIYTIELTAATEETSACSQSFPSVFLRFFHNTFTTHMSFQQVRMNPKHIKITFRDTTTVLKRFLKSLLSTSRSGRLHGLRWTRRREGRGGG